jgi:23S rRNA (pseudouridine1915-N3)-methyltransferase
MKITIALITPRRTGLHGPTAALFDLYLERCQRFTPCTQRIFPTEARLLDFLDDSATRTRPALLLADSRGQQVSSPELASILGTLQDTGTQHTLLAIGPADGWSPTALERAERTLAFGRITLPHELAAVVLAEQVYRALTIRAGHPYHAGH